MKPLTPVTLAGQGVLAALLAGALACASTSASTSAAGTPYIPKDDLPRAEAAPVLLPRLEPSVAERLPDLAALPPHPVAEAFGGGAIAEADLAAWNRAQTSYYSAVESPFYPGLAALGADEADDWPDGLPRTCLAISGGGIRASAFSLGVMEGLLANGVMRDVDLVSSVSGGSYAASYLYANALSLDPGEDDPLAALLGPDSPRLAELDEKAGRFVDFPDLLANAFGGVTGRLLFAVREIGVPNSVPRFDGGQVGYAYDIRRMYHHCKKWRMADVRALLEKRPGLPFPIIDVTVRSGRSPRCEDPADDADGADDEADESLALRAFEFTPLRHGSDGLGFTTRDPRMPLDRIVALSGAAVDDPGGPLCRYLAAPGLRLGAYIHGFVTAPRTWNGPADETLPAEAVSRHRIYLSDGAFADNLGAIAPIKRLCRRIVVIDSEHDPCLAFTGYQRLKLRLAEEMGADLSIAPLQALIDANTGPCPGDEACVRRPIGCGVEDDGVFRADRLETPLMEGTVSAFPFPGAPEPLRLEVIYLKLGFDQGRLADYGAAVSSVYSAQPVEACEVGLLSATCPFPQYVTTRQSYTAEEFGAYRELGRDTVRLFWPGSGPGSAKWKPR